MSLWDKYSTFIDRRITRYGEDEFLQDAQKDVEEAAVFDFTSQKHHHLLDFKPEQFFLPFNTCAIELWHPGGDPYEPEIGSGVRLALLGRPEGHEVGVGNGEHQWNIMVAHIPDQEPRHIRLVKLILKGPMHPAADLMHMNINGLLYSVCDYDISSGKTIYSWHHSGLDSTSPFVKEDRLLSGIATDNDRRRGLKHGASVFAMYAMSALHTANSPANWVVKVTDEHARVVKRRGKATEVRRTRLIVVPDRDLDRVIRAPSGASDYIERAPHRRRAHYRRLMSPKFRLKQGQRVYVRESWVGPKTGTGPGGEKYEVLTSLPSTKEDANE